jgi:hypothetical protein
MPVRQQPDQRLARRGPGWGWLVLVALLLAPVLFLVALYLSPTPLRVGNLRLLGPSSYSRLEFRYAQLAVPDLDPAHNYDIEAHRVGHVERFYARQVHFWPPFVVFVH